MDTTARNSLVIIAVVTMGAAMYWLREILTPLVLAIFLLFMIDGLSRVLRLRLPFLREKAAMPLALVLITLLFIACVILIADSAVGFAGQYSRVGPRLDAIIADVAGLVGVQVTPTFKDLLAEIDPRQFMGTAVQGVKSAGNIGASAFFTLVYLGFLIASRDGVRRKVVALFPERDERREAVHVFDRVRDGVEQYVWVQTVTGAIIGVACWAVMAAVGLENAVFWAFLIFLLSYIPIIGGAVAGIAPPLFALVQFPTYWQAIVLFAAIQVILFVVANIILPRMQAKAQNIDPVVVLLSLAFWGALWGATGAFLSTPLTVMFIAILAEFRGSRWVAILLSSDGEPYPEEDEQHPALKSPPKAGPKNPAKAKAKLKTT
ncbi:MAG TPA: AI-2E family transporter [Caulobacteraceae bacterium]|nr:AI-2E family transporter [Caulobacteraceae bacterium]